MSSAYAKPSQSNYWCSSGLQHAHEVLPLPPVCSLFIVTCLQVLVSSGQEVQVQVRPIVSYENSAGAL
jgi:hypothetical protein